MLLPDITALLLKLRPDLCERFGFDRPKNADAFVGWLITTGLKEYRVLGEHPEFHRHLQQRSPVSKLTRLQERVLQARRDVRSAFPLPKKLTEFRHWFYTYGVLEHDLWQFLTEEERNLALKLPGPCFDRLQELAANEALKSIPETLPSIQSLGVNLIGYAFGQLGIGEDARMATRALLAAGVPVNMLNFLPGDDVSQNDRSMAEHVSENGPYLFNLFCLTALEHGRYYLERGSGQLAGRYNIGYWPWELEKWPPAWKAITQLVDEVWVSSQHTYAALKPVCPVPIFLMPMAVELGSVAAFGSHAQTRQHFGLPETAKLFCFSFDLNSSIHRKNPQACVDAFRQAFPAADWSGDRVGLVIKAQRPAGRDAAWEKLKKLATRDARIHIVDEMLSRPDLLALYQACDCFVSLHRAEGFGRGIAEALQLGLHVIATGYSGNVDFCHPPDADLVRYRLVKVRKGQYPYGEGQVWAEPDVAHAAELMHTFVSTAHSHEAREWPEFSAAVVGERYRQRLEVLMRI